MTTTLRARAAAFLKWAHPDAESVALVRDLLAALPAPATVDPAAWAALPNNVHRRDVGEFALFIEANGNGWAWSVEWGDNNIATGEVTLTRRDGESPDAYEASMPRAMAACEEAARAAGVAVPLAPAGSPSHPAPVLTVGAALADPRVQAGACVVEYSGSHALLAALPEPAPVVAEAVERAMGGG